LAERARDIVIMVLGHWLLHADSLTACSARFPYMTISAIAMSTDSLFAPLRPVARGALHPVRRLFDLRIWSLVLLGCHMLSPSPFPMRIPLLATGSVAPIFKSDAREITALVFSKYSGSRGIVSRYRSASCQHAPEMLAVGASTFLGHQVFGSRSERARHCKRVDELARNAPLAPLQQTQIIFSFSSLNGGG